MFTKLKQKNDNNLKIKQIHNNTHSYSKKILENSNDNSKGITRNAHKYKTKNNNDSKIEQI